MVTVNNSDYYNNIPAGRDLNNLPKNYKEWDLMEDYYSDTEDNSKVKNFLSNMSVFTRWYSYETGINDRFGDYLR